MAMHVCSVCKTVFSDEAKYLGHDCPKTGFKPTNAEHLGDSFKFISNEALKRGEERKKVSK